MSNLWGIEPRPSLKLKRAMAIFANLGEDGRCTGTAGDFGVSKNGELDGQRVISGRWTVQLGSGYSDVKTTSAAPPLAGCMLPGVVG